MIKILPLFTRRVESHGSQAWTNPIILSVSQWFSRGSGFKLWHIQNGVFDILIATRHKILWFSLTFSYLRLFCKILRYPKHRKTLSWGKLIVINFTLTDLDNTKPSRKSGAVYDEFISYFWLGCPLFFPQAISLLILPTIGCPVNFLVVSDDWTTADFEQWERTERLERGECPNQLYVKVIFITEKWSGRGLLRPKSFLIM